MSSSAIQLLPKYHYLFNNEKTCTETEKNIDYVSSIWDDDQILRLDKKNWQCLWYNKNFQGIDAIKDISHVLRNKDVRIKSCYVLRKNLL